MKIKIKKNYLIGTLLSTFLIIGIINITNGQVIINTNPDISKLHTPSLISLFLGDNDSNYAQIKVNSGKNYLNISNGLIVGNNTIDSSAQLSVIGGGKSNVMNASNAGIGGGRQNRIYNDNGAIGGGERNTISEENGTIVGGNSNQVKQDNGGIVIGGYMNQSLGGIILGGKII